MHLVDPQIEDYALTHGDPEIPLLKELREETYAHMENPQMLSGPLQGQVLKQIAAIIQAKRILEVGMFTGYSTLCFAEGMAEGGHVITMELNPQAISIARKYFERSPHARQITIMEGLALESLKTVESSPPFDLVFIDADKVNYLNYYQEVLPLVRNGGVILADNVLWSGRVLNPQNDTDRGITAFNEFVKSDNRVNKVMLPIRDGIFVVQKKYHEDRQRRNNYRRRRGRAGSR